MERDERTSSIHPAGVMATACTQRRPDATREAPAVIVVGINWQLARDRPGRVGWRVDDPLDVVAVIAFLTTALIIARLMSTVRKQAEEALSSVSYRVIEAEEQERQRIAKDLHENIGQRVTLLVIEIEQLKAGLLKRGEMANRI